MKLKNLYTLCMCLMLSASLGLNAQETFSVRIAAPGDDLEEYLPGPNQTKTPGSFDVGSSDLELGCETANNVDPQLVGMRFTNITVPAGALITSAYIQFTVDATSKNTDPSNLIVKAQSAENAAAFDQNTPFNISSRSYLGDS
ncbi:MAG: hypothetical protein EAZ89_02120, partial [Bacteroidetes bacterium]